MIERRTFASILSSIVAIFLCLPLPASAADKLKADKEPVKDLAAGKGGYGGYGRNATGGAGQRSVDVSTFEELSKALQKGNATILLKADIFVPSSVGPQCIESKASNITLDGQGHTIHADDTRGSGRGSGHVLRFIGGQNFILKNFRIRNCNGGGNIEFKSASDIVVDHVSSTGVSNKGISISYGSHDATITNCFFAGNTRSIFLKYKDTERITIDHSIIMKFWIRGPLVSDVNDFDIRNNYIQEWVLFGTGIEGPKSNGNIMGNIYNRPADSKGPAGKPNNAIILRKSPGNVFIKDNVFKNCKGTTTGTADKPLDAPPIVPAYTADLVKLEKQLLSDEKGAGWHAA